MAAFISRLFRGRVQQGPPIRAATLLRGYETLEVVGESFYQAALWQIVGGFTRERVREPCRAVLVPEPTNPHDANAVQVIVAGQLVGHLSRQDAAAYLPGLSRLMASCETHYIALDGQSSAAASDTTASATSASSSTTILPTSESRRTTRQVATCAPGSTRQSQPTLATTATTSRG
jgi:hypothetical protein